MYKKNITYRTLSLILAFSIFSSSTSFALNLHFCQGEFSSISLFKNDDPCNKDPNSKCSKRSAKKNKIKNCHDGLDEDKKCCDNKTVFIQADLDQQFVSQSLMESESFHQFVAAFVYVFYFDNLIITEDVSSFQKYLPPLISKDIPVLKQSFLL